MFWCDFFVYAFEAVQRFVQRFGFLGEMESYQMIDVLLEKARTRHGADADVACEHLAEFEVALIAEVRDIQQDIVGALRYRVRDPDGIKSRKKEIALFRISPLQLSVIIIAEAQACHGCLLQRRSRTYRQKIMHLLSGIDDRLRCDDISQPPAGDGIGL